MARSVILKNGEQVKLNDHVYASPSWSVRDGTPYSIGRIMEFLPPADVPRPSISLENNPSSSSSHSSEHPEYLYTRVRLAWYYRPGDVSDRSVSDPRLLLAAIFSEICDINQIRGKCYVVHRDKITDLAGWKKRSDRFYFKSLFDPYVKREFEIISSGDVRNLPDHIRETLISRYEYVVAEKEVIPDLTDAIRLCQTCNEWCPSLESVQCDRCKSFFHMACVNPPLIAKPSRGYGWTCAPCAREHDEEVDSSKVQPNESNRNSTPNNQPAAPKPPVKTNAPPARGRGRPRKDKGQAEREENFPVKHFRMWPFRYFGQYTVAEDTLDPEDLIFPRTATRHGPKYQANVPPAPELDINPSEPDERGGDNTIEILGIMNTLTESEIEEVEARKLELAGDSKLLTSVDWLTEVVRRLSDAALFAKPWSSVNMKSPMRTERWKKYDTPYTDKEWSREEIAAFEDAIALHGAELRAVGEEVASRMMPEVVRFYGLWKNSKLHEENMERIRSGSPTKTPPAIYPADNPKFVQRVGLSDRESSIITSPSKPPTCAACRTKESTQWWKAPKGLSSNVMCDNCGQNWRKYADLVVRPARDESITGKRDRGGDREKNGTNAATGEKREGTPLTPPVAKKARGDSQTKSVDWTSLREFRNLKEIYNTGSPSPPPPPQIQCLVCSRSGMMGQVLECNKCKFRVHAGTGGVDLAPTNRKEFEMWMCDLCRNQEAQEASLNPDCLLCPRTRPEDRSAPFYPQPNSYLRACKPTEGQGWSHILCAVYTPEITFSDAPRLKLVEGISTISRARWTTTCKICSIAEGSTVRCSDCAADFHVSCAWKAGYRFGFEIQPVKGSRRDTTITVNFKNETGCMIPIISCKEHDPHNRELYDVCEREGSETALQVYCQAYKQAPAGQSHALLRKARRLDQILNLKSDPVAATHPLSVEPQCHRCSTTTSPAFHRVTVPDSPISRTDTWLCHKCHFSSAHSQINGVSEGGKMVGINEP